jgi:hypothetical protein
MEESELKKFVRGVIQDKNLSGVEQEVLEQLISDLSVRLENQINAALLQQLSDEDMVEFEQLLDSGEVDKIQNYFYNKNINVTEITAQVMSRFRAAYLSA